MTAVSSRGSRTIAAADLGVDYLQTSLADDEIIVDVRLPKDGGSSYAKFHRRAIDWSIVGVGCSLRGGAVHLGVTGLGSRPVGGSGASLDDALPAALAAASPTDDLDGSAEYKIHLAGVLARRAHAAAG